MSSYPSYGGEGQFPSRRPAGANAAPARRARPAPGSPPPAATPLLHQVPNYCAALANREQISPRTVEQYSHKVKQFARWCAGEQRVFDRTAVIAYIAHLRDRGLNPKTIRVTYTSIRNFALWLKHEGEQLPDLEGIRTPDRIAAYRRVPSDHEVKALVKAAELMSEFTPSLRQRKYRTRVALTLLLECGLRSTELLTLDLRDIRRYPPEGPEQPPQWTVYTRQAKGSMIREVPLSEPARRLLEDWLEERETWCKARPMRGPARDALLPVSCCRRLEYRGLKRLWDELLTLAGLADSGIKRHGCRHWFATVIAAEEDLRTAQAMLGHKSINTTEQYLHASPIKMRRASEALSAATHETRATQTRRGIANLPHRAKSNESRPATTARRLSRRTSR